MAELEVRFMQEAVALARANVAEGGRPFGAVLVRDGAVLARAVNRLHLTHDPTAHAELLAIRAACEQLGTLRLSGAVMYASGQPCPMCDAAMALCGIERAAYAYSNEDGAPYGLSTAALAAELALPVHGRVRPLDRLRPAGEAGLYEAWARSQGAR